jgi:hypothetical protein
LILAVLTSFFSVVRIPLWLARYLAKESWSKVRLETRREDDDGPEDLYSSRGRFFDDDGLDTTGTRRMMPVEDAGNLS